MVQRFNSLLIYVFDIHVPTIIRKVTRKLSPWLNEYIRQLQNQRYQSSARPSHPNYPMTGTYQRIHNKTQKQIRNAKLKFD